MICTCCEIDPRPGGHYRIGMKKQDEEYITVGEFLEVVEPQKLVFTWSWEYPADGVKNTLVTVEFRQVDNGTEIKLTHDRFPSDKSRDNHNQGWTGCLEHLLQLMERN